MIRRIFLFCLLGGCTCWVLYWLLDEGIIRLNYPSAERFPVQGIDISHHQGTIDWQKVAGDKNIRFVFIKATEGGDFKDPAFAENWHKSKEAGLVRGAYHFFTFCRSGEEQAKNVMETVPQEAGTLPLAIDLEFGGNCGKKPSRQEVIKELLAFLNVTQIKKPVFYVTAEFFDAYMKDDVSEFPEHYLWVRNIFYEPSQKECSQWTIWQFANRGKLAGITTAVDLNVFCAHQTDFNAMFALP